MFKKFEEERVFKEVISKPVCDLCGSTIKEGDPYIRINTQQAHYSRQYAYPEKLMVDRDLPRPPLDVCSADCLVKNATGISVVLNTKMIPAAREGCFDKATSAEQITSAEEAKSAEQMPACVKEYNYH